MRRNAYRLREMFLKKVNERRQLMSQKDYVDDSIDLLSMLVTNELFKDDDKKILDECLTMFFAGT